MIVNLAIFLGLLSGTPSSPAAAFPRGEVVSRVATAHDPGQQYSLYLPRGYQPERPAPVLFVLDPRGQAEYALGLFLEAAETHGWIVLSSYQSRSDTAATVTIQAFEALLEDAEKRFSLDPERYYLAGMSGTSHMAWHFASVLEGRVAGVIGCGGGLARHLDEPADNVPFAYYGLAGTTDFNYQEMWRLAGQLDERGAKYRLEIFEGRHGWPRSDTLTRAGVDWLELMAMRAGLAPQRAEWIDARLSTERAAAERLEDPVTVFFANRQLVRDFDGLRNIESDRQRLEAHDRAAVKSWKKTESKLAGREQIYLRDRLGPWLGHFQSDNPIYLSVSRALTELQIEALRKQSADTSRPQAADSAMRLLESSYVRTAFYTPREHRARGDARRAELSLRIAASIFPERSRPYWALAELYAERGRVEEAFEALGEAFARGRVDVPRLESDPAWESLRGGPRWKRLLDGIEPAERFERPDGPATDQSG